MWFSGFVIFCLSQLRSTYDENYRLQISPFFVSGKTWKTGSVSNTYLPHCIYVTSVKDKFPLCDEQNGQ